MELPAVSPFCHDIKCFGQPVIKAFATVSKLMATNINLLYSRNLHGYRIQGVCPYIKAFLVKWQHRNVSVVEVQILTDT